MKTTMDLINLTPSIPLGGDVRNRVWIGKYVCYGYLRVFRCRAFVHIPRYERSNLDKKSKQFLFIDYSQVEFGYILWDPIDNEIIRSCELIYLEDQNFEDFDKYDKHKCDARSYIDGVPKSPNETFVDDGDIHVDVENVVDGHVPHPDEPVKED